MEANLKITPLREFEAEICNGYIYSLEQFINLNRYNKITPHNGYIGEILIDGQVVNINLEGWTCRYGWAKNFAIMELAELERFYPGDIRIVWYPD